MWYMGGYSQNTCYASRTTASHWEKPSLDVVAGTNIVHHGAPRFVDRLARPARSRPGAALQDGVLARLRRSMLSMYFAPTASTGRAAGRTGPPAIARPSSTTRSASVWVFSLRNGGSGRAAAATGRRADFVARRAVARGRAGAVGRRRHPRSRRVPSTTSTPELYNLDCVAYESVLLGLFTIFARRARRTAKSRTTSASATAATAFTGIGRIAARFCRCPSTSATGTGRTCSRPAAAASSSATSLHFYVSGRRGVPGTNAPGPAPPAWPRCAATGSHRWMRRRPRHAFNE